MKKILFGLLLFAACSTPQSKDPLKNADNTQLYKSVMTKHDVIMVKTNKDIALEQKRLRELLDGKEDGEGKEKILDALNKLQEAREAMMNWMKDFKGLEADAKHYEALESNDINNYLKAEEVKITKVGELTNEALSTSKQILN